MTFPDKASAEALRSPVFEALLAQSRALHVVTDPQSRIIWSSKAFEELAGPLAAPGQTLSQCFTADVEDDDQELQRRMAVALLEGEFPETIVAWGARAPSATDPDTTVWLSLRIGKLEDLRLWTMNDIRVERASRLRLQRLEELLDTAQEFGNLGVWEREIASGKGRWDKRIFRYWGLDPIEGTPSFSEVRARVHPEDRSDSDFLHSTKRAGRYSQRFRLQLPDGSLRWLNSQWEIKAAPNGTPTHAVGVLFDESETVALERSLRETTAELTLALELGEIVIFHRELCSNRIHFNARGFDMLGLPFDTDGVSLKTIARLIPRDNRKEAKATAERALMDHGPVDMEIRLRRPDGQWRHVLTRRAVQKDSLNRPMAFVGVALDITDRLNAGQALRAANQRIALAARGAGIGTWEHDLLSDQVLWDEQMYKLRGLSMPIDAQRQRSAPSELRMSLGHPDELAEIVAANQRSFADGSMASYDFRVRWPDGNYRWLTSRSIPIRDESGRTIRQIGVNWDIHDRVLAEETRLEVQAVKRQSDAKSALLARMSHELRTPLNAILGFTDLLEIEGRAAHSKGSASTQVASRGQMLAHIRLAAEKLLELVDDVLDLSKLETSEMKVNLQPLELGSLLSEVVDSIRQKATQGAVRLRWNGIALTVFADDARLRQILIRLLSHHLSKIAGGAEITLTVTTIDKEARITISDKGPTQSNGRQYELFDLFGPLSTARSAGLDPDFGLCRALLTGMNGRIELVEHSNRGERFVIWLPLAPGRIVEEASPAAPAAASSAALAAAPTQAKVLYIEDNPVNVILVNELVSKRGNVEFRSAATGCSGVEGAREFLPDLILIDIQLPDIDGFEVLQRLRRDPATASIKCVALSANVIPEDVERARAAGFDDYWTKPIRFSSFLAGLDRLLPAADTQPGGKAARDFR